MYNKCIQDQLLEFERIIRMNSKLMKVLVALDKYSKINPNFKDYYIGAGSVNQTIFNYLSDKEIDYGIKDFDIVYFDSDLSYEAEDKIIQKIDIDLKIDESESRKVSEDEDKSEEKAQQWEKYSQVEIQQESILQVNTTPHQLIVKEERHGKHDKPLSIIPSLITSTSLATIWKVFPGYMNFMESLAKRQKCKEDVFYVTFMPP